MSTNIELLAAVGYVRVSTDQQADHGIGLETQLESLRAYALIHKLNLVEIISDEGISGTIPLKDRAGGARLTDMLGRKVRHVVALKLDRLFRNAADALAQTELWDRQGITVHLIDVGGTSINSSSAVGRMFLTRPELSPDGGALGCAKIGRGAAPLVKIPYITNPRAKHVPPPR